MAMRRLLLGACCSAARSTVRVLLGWTLHLAALLGITRWLLLFARLALFSVLLMPAFLSVLTYYVLDKNIVKHVRYGELQLDMLTAGHPYHASVARCCDHRA